MAILFLIFCFNLISKETLIYEKISGKGNQTINYEVNKKTTGYEIAIKAKEQQSHITAKDPYQLQSIDVKKTTGDEYFFEVKGNMIEARGTINGEKLFANHRIDKKNPWVQEFDFGLLPLLSSNKTSLNFQLINPKNFKMHKLVAKKVKEEAIKIKEILYDAVLVEITLQGFKSMFWKARIWYDKKTHDLLLYKSDEGPNTASTTVTLISKTAKID
jgi:hypothetical protein